MVSAAFPNRPFNLRDEVWLISQDIPNNRSLVGFNLWIDKTAYSPTFSDGIAHRWMRINGSFVHESYGTGFDFRNGSNFLLASGNVWVPHNADGTKTFAVEASANYAILGSTSLVFPSFGLPTIPRASTATWAIPGPATAGVAKTLNTNRASTSFTHDLYYAFGNTGWVPIAGGVTDSVSWTPPLSLLNQIPNSTNGFGGILTYTFSGGNLVGSTISSFELVASASVVPSWTSVSLSEDNATVASLIGAYVQGISRIDYSINGAAGVYGSTISLQRFSVSGQTLDGASGTTGTITASGTIPATFTIQDSRGRQKTQTNNIAVLPYAAPVITSLNVQRALNDGTVDTDDGTYLRVDLSALSHSLINVVEKNIIQIKIYSRIRGTSAWTLKQTLNPSGISYNSFAVIPGPYAVNSSYEVRVEVLDRFNTSAALATVSVAAVFMHWGLGLGVGKYHENGALDVNGDIYVSGSVFAAGLSLGLLDPEYVGPGPARVYDLQNTGAGLSPVAYEWEGTYYPWGNRVVNLKKTPTSYVITGHNNQVQTTTGFTGGKFALAHQNGWRNYGASTASNQYSELSAARLPSGIVILSGTIQDGLLTTNTIVATLPPGMRPDVDMVFPDLNNATVRSVTIEAATGYIKIRVGHTASFVSLDGIAFPAAGVANWTNIGSGGSSYANSWAAFKTANYGIPRYWKDPYGLVWFSGMIYNGSTASDNLTMVNLPATHRSAAEQHNLVVSVEGYGLIGSRNTDGLNWKAGATNPAWISLAGMNLITTDALDAGVWYSIPMVNGWSNYPGAFTTFAATRRGDGLALSKGLIRSGTVSPTIRFSAAPRHMHPEFTQIIPTASNGAAGRLDVSGRESRSDTHTGSMFANFGSNGWFSLDGKKWMVG